MRLTWIKYRDNLGFIVIINEFSYVPLLCL